MSEVAARWQGREVVLGVRPEGLCPSREGKFVWEENAFDAKVMVLEPLGDKVDLALAADGGGRGVRRMSTWSAGPMRISLAKPQLAGIMKVYMDLGRVHLF